jgi:integrase
VGLRRAPRRTARFAGGRGYLEVHQAAPATIAKLRWLLAKAIRAFGEVRLLDLRAEEICAWRGTLPEGHRREATQALRQVLNRAVQWQLIDVNPAKRGVSNPLRRFPEKRPFESWTEISAIAGRLGPVTGPMVVFAAATGVRPAELAALEQRDLDRAGGVVYVRRQLLRGQIKHTKTRRSMRAVPLQSAALEALERLSRLESPLLFPSPRGGYLDLHNCRAREWRPAQLAAGIEPVPPPYHERPRTCPQYLSPDLPGGQRRDLASRRSGSAGISLGRADRAAQVSTRLLAMSTGFGADAAVLVMAGSPSSSSTWAVASPLRCGRRSMRSRSQPHSRTCTTGVVL